MRSILFLSILFLVSLTLTTCTNSPSDRVKVCINNCGQCKAMYGNYFMGQQCAESCLTRAKEIGSGQIRLPDCNSPTSIMPFIRKLVDDNNIDVI